MSVGATEKAREQAKLTLRDDCDDFIEHAKPEEIRFLHEVLAQWRLDPALTDLPIAEAFDLFAGNLASHWMRVRPTDYQQVKHYASALESGQPTAPLGNGRHLWKNPKPATAPVAN